VKTTTVAIFLANLMSQSRGEVHTNILRRTVPGKNINEARAIILIAVALLLILTSLWHGLRRGLSLIGKRPCASSILALRSCRPLRPWGSRPESPPVELLGKLQIAS